MLKTYQEISAIVKALADAASAHRYIVTTFDYEAGGFYAYIDLGGALQQLLFEEGDGGYVISKVSFMKKED